MTLDEWSATLDTVAKPKPGQSHKAIRRKEGCVAAYIMLQRIQRGGEARPSRQEVEALLARLEKLIA